MTSWPTRCPSSRSSRGLVTFIETTPPSQPGALGLIESTSRKRTGRDAPAARGARRRERARPSAPVPGLDDLPSLVAARGRRARGDATVDRGGRERSPAGVDISAYRIVQEALTNVLKHGGPARTCGSPLDAGAELEVTDEGRPRSTRIEPSRNAESATGHGLLGMRERVALYGGSFEAGPRPGGGFRVHASLPYAAGSA